MTENDSTKRLRPLDWRSGERLWVVEVIAPGAWPGPGSGRGNDAMVQNLKKNVFPGRELRVLTLKDGKREVRVV